MFYPEVHIMSLTPPITIRPVSTADSQALLDIYRPYVEHTAITFEYEVPTAEEFTRRIRHTLKRYPYLPFSVVVLGNFRRFLLVIFLFLFLHLDFSFIYNKFSMPFWDFFY